MSTSMTIEQFETRFPDDEFCLEEIKRLRYPDGIFCTICNRITKHYKLSNRTAYTCKECRNHLYPLAGTIFDKTTTPLRIWFFAMFLMTHSKGAITAKQLQRELGVTYKTAWRIQKSLYMLMKQNNGDLLKGTIELEEQDPHRSTIRKWTFFNKLEIKVVQTRRSQSV